LIFVPLPKVAVQALAKIENGSSYFFWTGNVAAHLHAAANHHRLFRSPRWRSPVVSTKRARKPGRLV
jgi:hypothetical protein